MPKKLLWTPLALTDLLEIRDDIRRDHPSAARREAEKIKKSVERLARFPLSGRESVSIPTVREIVAGSYRIFYRAHPNRVEILRIYHGRGSGKTPTATSPLWIYG